MKKIISFCILIALVASLLAGCNKDNNTTNIEKQDEISEEEKDEQTVKGLEQKDHEKITKMSEEELLENEGKYSEELYDLCENLSGFYTNDVKESEFYENNDEFRAYVDKVLAMGYGIFQSEGMYYLYVGEEPQDNDGEVDTGENGSNEVADLDDINSAALIESSGNNYYKFKVNTNVYFDIDEDGTKEEIKYDTKAWKLIVKGYEPIDIEIHPGWEGESFIIINYTDKYDQSMNMIGIYDPGASVDPVTTFYSIIAPQGEKMFVDVGSITAELVDKADYKNPYDFYDFSKKPSTKYLESTEDFMQKAFLVEGEGIEAPVMLTTEIPQVWFGRTLFTYYSTYFSLVNGSAKYEEDYSTYCVLEVIHDVKAYAQKDSNGVFEIIKAGQNVLLYATDNKEWVAMEAEDGTKGWVHINDISHENFEGLVVFG